MFSPRSRRATRPEPTKSGVIGLVAALDVPEKMTSATSPRFISAFEPTGPGAPFATTTPHRTSFQHQAESQIEASVSQRYYVADASFLAGLEGDQTVVASVHQALAAPAVPLTLGRRSCSPSVPVYVPDGLDGRPLEELLSIWPLLAEDLGEVFPGPEQLRVAIETDLDSADHTNRHHPSRGANDSTRTDRDPSIGPRRARAPPMNETERPVPPDRAGSR